MKYTGTTWRPPFEAYSLLLQVTVGCSHNACTFCSMYRDVPFQTESLEQIEKDLREARVTYPRVDRVFLVNADPFCLSGSKLKAIASKIIEILPEVESIGMYASVQNIAGKTDAELAELKALRISGLNVGLESGLPEVLQELNKGFTLDEAVHQLQRLNTAGIEFSINIILGAAGADKYKEHAIASAKVLNLVQPALLFVATLHLEEESPLRTRLLDGTFREDTLQQTIEEELLLLEHLDLTHCRFFGVHPSNAVRLDGMVPRDTERMLQTLDTQRKAMHAKDLETPYTQLVRGREGAIILSS